MKSKAPALQEMVTFGFYFTAPQDVQGALLFLMEDLREYLREWRIPLPNSKSKKWKEQIFTVHLAEAAALLLRHPETAAYGQFRQNNKSYPLRLSVQYPKSGDKGQAAAVLLELPRKDVFENNTDMTVFDALMMNKMEEAYGFMPYAYAFCDGLRTPPVEEKALREAALCPYSFLLLPKKDEMELRLGKLEPDGKTKRQDTETE